MENQANATACSVIQAPSPMESMVVVAEYPRADPDRVYSFWTTPALLCSWWPQEAELDVRVGGAYRLSWPAMHWRLRGRYTAVQPGARLAFTWVWEHEANDVRGVEVTFSAHQGGTRVTVRQGPYADTSTDRESRTGHIEGWLHCLGQLGVCLAPTT
jgi:uncharacterized protein YndB with AHSA1/START domain